MVHLDALAALPLFRGLTSVELEEIASLLVPSRAAAGDPIINEGDAPGHPVYVLLRGAVEIVKAGVDRRPHVIGSLSAPSVFGEVEVLARRPAIASVVAAAECELALLHRGLFDELASANRSGILKVIKNLAGTLAYRLAATDERLAAYFDIGDAVTQKQIHGVIYSGWRQD